MDEFIIRLDNVCFAYNGSIALKHINLNVTAGETIVLQGSNGCGKSTLLKLLNGLIYAEEGTYIFKDIAINESTMKNSKISKKFHQKMGFVFQNSDVQLFCSNVREEIAFGPMQMGLSEEEVNKRVEDMLNLFNIKKLSDRAPYQLSGGEKKKVALACILSMSPEVLILDEPLAGLDIKTQKWLIEFLRVLKESGKTMIISTHNETLANTLADRFVYMNDEHEIEQIVYKVTL